MIFFAIGAGVAQNHRGSLLMPCVCAVCGCRFDLPPVRPGELWALVCTDCGCALCPDCRSHNTYNIIDRVVVVPAHLAASVRASVWGRGQ